MEQKLNEEEMIRGLRAQDPKAQTYVFLEYYTQLIKFAERIVRDAPVAKDIAMQAMIALCTQAPAIRKLDKMGDVKAFLFVVARNKAYDYNKTKIQSDSFLMEYVNMSGSSENIKLRGDSVLEILVHRELSNYLKNTTEQARLVFIELYKNGRTVKEVSDLLETSESNVRNQSSKVIKKIREIVHKYRADIETVETVISLLVLLGTIVHAIFNW